jgi:hypothetical protein
MVLSGEWKRRMNGIQITFCNTGGKVDTAVFYLGRASKKEGIEGRILQNWRKYFHLIALRGKCRKFCKRDDPKKIQSSNSFSLPK